MYSGTTFTNVSGNLLGVHQKINRTARQALSNIVDVDNFPNSKQINYFEGRNGPDGIKSKSPGQDEPWHYYDPYDPGDTQLFKMINDHYKNLVKELVKGDMERSSFEAAWLAHALVDGLTPAHHYPYEQELERIRGASKESRNTIRRKLMVKGDTRRDSFRSNWRIWGAKGLFTTHFLFEWGVATILAPHKILNTVPSEEEITQARKEGVSQMFARSARKIAGQFAYDEFYRRGWTPALAQWVRKDLAPEIARVVVLAWYLALEESSSKQTA